MSKITFRADSDLVDAVEAMDASKSEVMRDALRAYLERTAGVSPSPLEEVLAGSSDAVVDRRFDGDRSSTRDVNVRVLVESAHDQRAGEERASGHRHGSPGERGGAAEGRGGHEQTCTQCGGSLSSDHVYCPNCGEQSTNQLFCECGDEVRADWAFCPQCGRRTASAEAFDR